MAIETRHPRFETDGGAGAKATLGLIILQADETLEAEFRTLALPPDTALYHTRIPSGTAVTPDTLIQMRAQLGQTAALLPSYEPMAAIAYACTSGATVIGAENVDAEIRHAHPSARITDPARAIVAALRHLGLTKVAVLSPYMQPVSDAVCAMLAQNGLHPARVASFNQPEEATVARITEVSVRDAVIELGSAPDVEAVFTSCTNLRTFGVIEDCEAAIGKPVISSNSALAWHLLTLASLPAKQAGPGRLFAT